MDVLTGRGFDSLQLHFFSRPEDLFPCGKDHLVLHVGGTQGLIIIVGDANGGLGDGHDATKA